MPMATHPSPDALTAFALGRLPESERAALAGHVAGCDRCRRQVAAVGGDPPPNPDRAATADTPAPGPGATPPALAGLPGPLVDHPRYRVLARLGAGGMGTVYKAEHRMMGRTVALKVINPEMMSKPGAVARFRREVRLAAKLHHPNIVTAHDAEEAGGLHFLVMEYVEGTSLDRLVARRGPLPVATACHYARQAALGLQHAHEKGMVHRDVKPHNLMVTRKGRVKVLDFGLACLAPGAVGAPVSTGTTIQVSTPGMILGTPDFVAPEQARGAGADGRSDLYSLGCTLYFLLTGRVPFEKEIPFEKLLAHAEEPPPPLAAARPDAPPALADLLARLMAKDPEDRPQTPAELAAALQPFARPPASSSAARTPVPPAAGPADEPDSDTVAVAAPPAATVDVEPPRRKRRKRPVPFVQRHRTALIAGAVGLAVLLAALLAAVLVAAALAGR